MYAGKSTHNGFFTPIEAAAEWRDRAHKNSTVPRVRPSCWISLRRICQAVLEQLPAVVPDDRALRRASRPDRAPARARGDAACRQPGIAKRRSSALPTEIEDGHATCEPRVVGQFETQKAKPRRSGADLGWWLSSSQRFFGLPLSSVPFVSCSPSLK